MRTDDVISAKQISWFGSNFSANNIFVGLVISFDNYIFYAGFFAFYNVHLVADVFSAEILDQFVEKYWRREVEKPSKIGIVVRPANIKVVDNESFIGAERNRINFWITG